MPKRIGLAVAALLAALMAGALEPAAAQVGCNKNSTTVEGCTAVIQSGQYSGANLAIAYYNRALAYDGLVQYDRALEDYDTAIGLNPAYVDAYNNRCYDRAVVGRLSEALDDCNEAMRLDPGNNNGENLNTRAFVRLKMKDYAGAIADYDADLAVRQDPDSLYGRGLARQLSGGDSAAAAADIAAAKKIDPDIADKFGK